MYRGLACGNFGARRWISFDRIPPAGPTSVEHAVQVPLEAREVLVDPPPKSRVQGDAVVAASDRRAGPPTALDPFGTDCLEDRFEFLRGR